MELNRKNYESWFLDYYEGTLSPGQVAELFLFLEQHPDLREEFESFEMIRLDADMPAVSFDEKASLHRTTFTDEEVKQQFPALLEGDLENAEAYLQVIHSRPALLAEWTLFRQTKLPESPSVFPLKKTLKKNSAVTPEAEQLLVAALEGDLNLQQQIRLQQLLKEQPALVREKELLSQTRLQAEPVIFHAKDKLKKREARILLLHRQMFARIAASLLIVLGAWYTLNYNGIPTTPEVIVKNHPSPIIKPAPEIRKDQPVVGPVTKENSQVTPVTANPETVSNAAPDKHLAVTTPAVTNNTNVISRDKEEYLASIEPMQPREAIIPEEEPFVAVHRRPVFNTLPVQQEATQSLEPAAILKDVAREVAQTAATTLDKATENTPLAAEDNGHKLTLGSRVIRSLAWAVGKASDERIKIKTTFDPIHGTLAAYEVETANRKWQKQF